MNLICRIIFVLTFILPFNLQAATYEGTVKGVKVCGAYEKYPGWLTMVLFQLNNDKWFGLRGNHYERDNGGNQDRNMYYSLVMSAYTTQDPIEIGMNDSLRVINLCGVSANMVDIKDGDYIYIKK